VAEWSPIWAMPNLRLKKAIEGGGRAAIAPISDPRVIELAENHPRFRSFLGKFHDAFKVDVEPCVFLTKKPKTKKPRLEPLASFRDLVALSVIPYARAHALVYKSPAYRLYSNVFYLYPWMLDNKYEHLITHTTSGTGFHDVRKFSGQSTPDIFAQDLDPGDIDEPLFNELVTRWNRRYFKPNPSHADIALFRSLNMAHVASQVPGVVDTTMYDVGRTIALWVSAFEILAHPGPGQKVHVTTIYDLFENIEYQDKNIGRRRYSAWMPSLSRHTKGNLPRFVYGQLYQARNAFLHGNEVSGAILRAKGSPTRLFNVAPPLYRLALTAVLELKMAKYMPSMDEPKEFGKHLVERMKYYGYQEMAERAVLRVRRSKKS
jgi:hypothetical protein